MTHDNQNMMMNQKSYTNQGASILEIVLYGTNSFSHIEGWLYIFYDIEPNNEQQNQTQESQRKN